MIKTVIFDMDGLLIDSQSAWYEAIEEVLSKRGLKYVPRLFNRVIGAGHKEIIGIFKKELGLTGNTEDLIVEMRNCFYKYFLSKPRLMTGAKEIVDSLKKRKYKLSLTTGTGPGNKVIEMLKDLGMKQYFDAIVTGDDAVKGKPDPEIYLYTAKKLGVEPLNCVVLEDAINGILAGKRAGMRVFGVNKDRKIREKLKEAGADRVFSSLSEIKNI